MSNFEIISKIPLFNGLPERYIKNLVNIVVNRQFKKGQTIFFEGEKAKGFYVITLGRVKIFKLSSEGKEQILHILGPGEPFGEVPMFSGGHFPAHAEALEESNILFFPRVAFIELIKKEPLLAMNMLAVLSKRLREFTHLIEDLSLKEVSGRLAAYFLYLSDREKGACELELNITKTQLAAILGTIPETLSRILGKMNSQGIIHIQGRRVKLLNKKILEDISSGEKIS